MEIIQPKIQKNTTTIFEGKLLTCAYCRVSTSSELQLNSYDAQVKHYTEYIQNNPEWEFAGIYSDEGISGTSVKKRTNFMRMIADAKNGKINLVICKSISRFGRNTTDILKYIRILKDYNVAVFFENENINTLTAIGEVLITILASLAQDGSRQISENVNWGVDKAFKSGKAFGNNKVLGYKIKNGKIVIIEEEAKIVRFIFDSYLSGDGAVKIAKKLDEMGIPTPLKSKRWNATTILNMLKNERYAGHLLQQKYYTVDYLSHKRLKNKGEIRQYLFRNNHTAIIEPAKWDLVQLEIKRRRTMQNNETGRATKHSNKYCWSGKLECSNCGDGFRRVVWHKKHVAWQCQGYALYGKKHCDIGAIKEEILENIIVSLCKYMKVNQTDILNLVQTVIKKNVKFENNQDQIKELEKEIQGLIEEISGLRSMCARQLISDNEFLIDRKKLEDKIDKKQTRLMELQKNNIDNMTSLEHIKNIQDYIEKYDMNKFDENFVRNFIKKIIVVNKDVFRVYINPIDKWYYEINQENVFISTTQDVLLNRYKCNLSHLFNKYSNLKENYSDIVVELYIAV